MRLYKETDIEAAWLLPAAEYQNRILVKVFRFTSTALPCLATVSYNLHTGMESSSEQEGHEKDGVLLAEDGWWPLPPDLLMSASDQETNMAFKRFREIVGEQVEEDQADELDLQESIEGRRLQHFGLKIRAVPGSLLVGIRKLFFASNMRLFMRIMKANSTMLTISTSLLLRTRGVLSWPCSLFFEANAAFCCFESFALCSECFNLQKLNLPALPKFALSDVRISEPQQEGLTAFFWGIS
ncbi:unnamed protein product [Durusdinium trenchii]|uniref:Uncharacterized protein n=1 Tax=Durusdinium trenchii TaxID=1381693 RepID=A0ABP0KPP8_9DINO